MPRELSAFFAMNSECVQRCAQIEDTDRIRGERVNTIEESSVTPMGFRIVWRDYRGERHVEDHRRENV